MKSKTITLTSTFKKSAFYLRKTTIFHKIHKIKNQNFIKKCINKFTQTEQINLSPKNDFGIKIGPK